MAFPSPPSPELQPFSTQGPAYSDPLQTLAQMQQMRLHGLQQQEAQLGLQKAQIELESTRGLMKAWQDAGGDLMQMAKIANDPKYNIAPGAMMNMQTTMASLAKERAQTALFGAEADKNKQAAQDARHDALYNAYQEVWDEKDPLKQQAILQEINPQLAKQGYRPDELIPVGNPQALQHAKYAYTTLTNIKDMAEKRLKEAQTTEAGARAGEATAKTAQSELERQLLKHKVDLYDTLNQNPQALDKRVDASIDPQKYPTLNARAKNEARQQADLEGINKVIESYGRLASEQEKTIATETDPAVRQARVQQAVSTAQAVAPIETARSVATAVATEKAKAALSPDVFNRIVDPTSRNRAIMETEKYTKEYITKVNDAQKMLDTIDAAQGGNQAASGLIPLEEIRSIVNRVNRQELESVSGGGSLVRRVENMLSQATSGRMSGAQLKDLRALGNLQKEGANRAYQGSRLGTQTIYGVKPPEVDLSGIVRPAGGAAPAAPVNPNPRGYVPGHVYGGMTYLGGDPNKRASWK